MAHAVSSDISHPKEEMVGLLMKYLKEHALLDKAEKNLIKTDENLQGVLKSAVPVEGKLRVPIDAVIKE